MFRFSKSGSFDPALPVFFFLFEPPSVQFSLSIENQLGFHRGGPGPSLDNFYVNKKHRR
jgi:hypothetical protein